MAALPLPATLSFEAKGVAVALLCIVPQRHDAIPSGAWPLVVNWHHHRGDTFH
jgi:hypothetical protein